MLLAASLITFNAMLNSSKLGKLENPLDNLHF
jgi:hypothetical protein